MTPRLDGLKSRILSLTHPSWTDKDRRGRTHTKQAGKWTELTTPGRGSGRVKISAELADFVEKNRWYPIYKFFGLILAIKLFQSCLIFTILRLRK